MGCGALWAQELYTISPVSFNTRECNEFSAIPYKNGVVFCSDRSHNIFITRLDSLNRPLLDLYFVRKKENQKWGITEVFDKKLSGNFHKGPLTFGKNQTTLYFTRNDASSAGIYTATFNGNSWDKITPFVYNEVNAKVAHPCISADGKKLFFVSDKKGGYGGFDIYVSILSHNQWSRPKNLGPEINTENDELYPFYCNNGKLYFASKRPGGYGGLDIYFSKEINNKWLAPILLDMPVNSKGNDFAFWSDSTDRNGYISSDRNSRTGLTDIFEFNMNCPVLNEFTCKPQKKNSYTYNFSEVRTVNTDSAPYRYEWDFGDGTKARDLKVNHTFAKPGDYLVQLNVIDTLADKIFMNQAGDIFPVRNNEQPFITSKDTTMLNEVIVFDASEETYLPQIKDLNYYWDFDDGVIAIGKQVKHKFQEPGTYHIMLGIIGLNAKKQPVTYCSSKQIIVKNSSSQ